METEKIWNQTLSALQGKVSKQIFETWFQTANLESLKEGKVKIGVPNRFFGDWLKDHYQDVLVETLNGLLQRDDVEITFGVKMEKIEASIKDKDLKEDEPVERRNWVGAALNPKYTFNTFVVGSSNQFSHAATQAVAENPARSYNPLFIYGGVGLGKTHLLNAIGNYVLLHKRLKRIVYVSSEQFTNEVINSIRYDRMGEFRNRYRNIDMLLVDDIQFIAGKERTQEEFFHTFNTLYESQKQISLTVLNMIPFLEEPLGRRIIFLLSKKIDCLLSISL